MKKTVFFLLFLAIGFQAKSQISFDIPGQFVIDFGINQMLDYPEELDLNAWGSRGINLYYLYEFNLIGEKFTFHPGFGLGLESYSFTNDITLVRNLATEMVDITNISAAYPRTDEVIKSKVTANYFDIPLELRFRTNPGRSAFRIGIGGKIGVLFDSHTKIKFRDTSNELVKAKEKDNFYFSRFRYGLSGRIGMGPINFFGYYGLNYLFEDGKLENGAEITPFMFGVTLTAL